MRQRRYVDDLSHLDSCAMHRTDGRLTAISGTLDIGFHLAQAQIISNLGTILSCHLCGIPILPAEDQEIICPSLLANDTMILLKEL